MMMMTMGTMMMRTMTLQVEKREKKARLIGLLRELGGAKTLVFLRFAQQIQKDDIRC